MNQSSSFGFGFVIIFVGDAIRALPDDSSAEQSYHADNGKNDVGLVPKHKENCGLAGVNVL